MPYINTKTKEFGLSIDDVRRACPESSIPEGAAIEPFQPYATSDLPPYDPATHRLGEVPPAKVGGALKQQWALVALTPAEVAAARKALVPRTVTRKQANKALIHAGLYEQVPAAIAAIQDPTARLLATVEWADSPTFERDSPLLASVAERLGLGETELDDLFIRAAAL